MQAGSMELEGIYTRDGYGGKILRKGKGVRAVPFCELRSACMEVERLDSVRSRT